MNRRTKLSAIAVAIALLAVASYEMAPRVSERAALQAEPTLPPSAVNALPERRPVIPLATTPKPTTVVAIENSSSLAAKVDRLVKTGKPEDAYAAFRILSLCRMDDKCGDLTPGQKTMTYPLLKQAVAGHVPRSSVWLYSTTPDGRPPNEVFGDPAYAGWEADARREVADAAARGDMAAQQQMAWWAFDKGDMVKAVTYWVASADHLPSLGPAPGLFTSKLTPEQIAAAEAEGHAMNGGRK